MREDHGVVVLIKKNGEFLLLEDCREPMVGFWAPPHGRCKEIDVDEEATVIRETLEETGLNVNPIKKIWTTKADTKVKTVSFWLAEVKSGDIRIDTSESSNYGWYTIDNALKLKLYPGTNQFFTLVKQGEILV